jgi:hypothetical protein
MATDRHASSLKNKASCCLQLKTSRVPTSHWQDASGTHSKTRQIPNQHVEIGHPARYSEHKYTHQTPPRPPSTQRRLSCCARTNFRNVTLTAMAQAAGLRPHISRRHTSVALSSYTPCRATPQTQRINPLTISVAKNAFRDRSQCGDKIPTRQKPDPT